ncbi:beta-N-acetylhexosaminidase [Paenibacillus soyae]|uniref:beta-N-acetylhexosaminidase n=1 Tax=Paenibacillus soyae TaxID=2969249 RepID=A0A9X2MPH3_9BACL|nr:family 20 glycosylhydrolase [Paenibacillus soyae]MCR2803819.1 family 20 glycosylhydrolase [Paenibacillus soyae]
MSETLNLYPPPKKLEWAEGSSAIGSSFVIHAQDEQSERIAFELRLQERLNAAAARIGGGGSSDKTAVNVVRREGLHPQGYMAEWDGGEVTLFFGEAEGLHYAAVTLEQLLVRHGRRWPHFRIEDEPDFPVRGIMLDIGRGKIPKLETLYALVDRMSALKFNHLQLYMEGFDFDYNEFRDSFPEATPITAGEFRLLDAYANERFVDLVPSQNCLGHMGPWLAKPAFADLAEHPGGQATPLPVKLPPTTLNPTDPRSLELVGKMFDELLPHFASGYVNVNMDEPFGLGRGQSKQRADEIGVPRLYMEYASKVFDIARSHGKRILMWGDIVTKHKEIIPLLPPDVTVLDWNYDDHTSFEAHCKLLSESGVPFFVCPGTSTWSAITGRTDNMLANIADAARHGKAHGAGGLIVTDWGDSGHWQPPVASYPAYALAAAASWHTAKGALDHAAMEQYVTECMLRDGSGAAGKLTLELGRYYHLENSTLENMTYTSYLLNRGLSSREKLESETQMLVQLLVEIGGRGIPFALDYRYEEMQDWLRSREEELSGLRLDLPDAELIKEELRNALRLVAHGAGLHRYIFGLELPDAEAERAWLAHLQADLADIIETFNRLWLARNRQGGLEASARNLYKLLGQYEDRLRDCEAKKEK